VAGARSGAPLRAPAAAASAFGALRRCHLVVTPL